VPRSAGGVYSAAPDLAAGFMGERKEEGKRKGKERKKMR